MKTLHCLLTLCLFLQFNLNRSVLALQAGNQDPSLLDQISKNVTRQGITPATLNYLRVRLCTCELWSILANGRFPQLCVILEPMQELMSRHKAYALSPRDCLKTTLFQKWQRMVAPPGLTFFMNAALESFIISHSWLLSLEQKLKDLQTNDVSVKAPKQAGVLESIKHSRLRQIKNDHPVRISR